jgi:hypothetical protein
MVNGSITAPLLNVDCHVIRVDPGWKTLSKDVLITQVMCVVVVMVMLIVDTSGVPSTDIYGLKVFR